jgi:hypothetical protein
VTVTKLPINSPIYTDINGVEGRDLSSELWDAYLNELGHTVKRPGLGAFKTLSATAPGVDGMFYSRTHDCVYAVHNSVIYKITYNGTTVTSTALTTPVGLIQDKPCSFALAWVSSTQKEVILIANGDKILVLDGYTNTVTTVTDAVAPTGVTQLAVVDRYVIAVNNGPYFYYSYPGQPTVWYSFSLPDTNTDLALAVRTLKGEAFIFGSESTEIWQTSGDSNVFERVQGGAEEIGCLAKNSVIVAPPYRMFWLSNYSQYAMWSGSRIELITSPYDKEIGSYLDPELCFSSYVRVDGQSFVLFHYVGQGVTHCLNLQNITWSKWGSWQEADAEYQAFPGVSSCYWPKWGLSLIGAGSTGTVYSLSKNTYQDVTGKIRPYRKTGALDLGTFERKESRDFKIRVNRGTVSTSTEPQLAVRFKDDGQYIGNETFYSLGNYDSSDCQIAGYRNGIYHSRQWEVYTTDPVPFVIVDAYENVEVL